MNYIWKQYPSEESIVSTTLTEQKKSRLILIPLDNSIEDNTTKDSIDTFITSIPALIPIPIQISSIDLPEPNSNTLITTIQDTQFKQTKKGRYKKGEFIPNSASISFHSKLYHDNIKRKIKTHFHNFLITFINNEIKKEWKIQKYKLRKMDSRITQNITIAYNKKLLESPIKDILRRVSMKFRDQSTNQNFIDKIIKSKPQLCELLNGTYEFLFTNYYLTSTSEMFKGAVKDESFEQHLNKIEAKDGVEYKERYIENAMQFVDFFKNCKERSRRRSKALSDE